jgi:hypothetical protein
MDDDDGGNVNSILYLCAYLQNGPKANYEFSTSKTRGEKHIHKIQTKITCI